MISKLRRRSESTFSGSVGARQGCPPFRRRFAAFDTRQPLPCLAFIGASDESAPWHNASDVKLRNAHLATVDRSKVVDYLLNEAHPDNGGKAVFFVSLGFSRDQPELLTNALREVAERGKVVQREESTHGEKYVVDGSLSVHTQESGPRSVRTVWIIDAGKDAPRLVTAYPGQE